MSLTALFRQIHLTDLGVSLLLFTVVAGTLISPQTLLYQDIISIDVHQQIAEEDLHRSQSNRSIIKLLACLSIEQRQVVELKLFQNMTFDDIEHYTGLSANTAKTRFYTALKKMKENPEIAHAI